MSQKVIIFDFDGTLADTHKHTVDIFNSFAQEYKYKTIPWEHIDVYKNMSVPQLIRKLKIPVLKIPSIVSRGKRQYNQLIPFMQPIDGIREALLALKEQPVKLGILSSNAHENIMLFLENNNMLLFDFVHSTSRLTSKNTALTKLIKDEHLAPQDIIYVGDEIRDVLAANKVQIAVAAVGWGFNSGKSLQKHKPTYYLATPADLVTLVDAKPIKRRHWLRKLKPAFADKIIARIKSRRQRKKTPHVS